MVVFCKMSGDEIHLRPTYAQVAASPPQSDAGSETGNGGREEQRKSTTPENMGSSKPKTAAEEGNKRFENHLFCKYLGIPRSDKKGSTGSSAGSEPELINVKICFF